MKIDIDKLWAQALGQCAEKTVTHYTNLVIDECAKACWGLSDDLSHRDDMLSEQGMAQRCATVIRSLAP